MLNYWNDLLVITLGINTFFSILKFLSFMKFRKITGFIQVLRLSFKPLLNFSVVFSIVFLAFSQFFYLLFNVKYKFYSTFVSSIETCFLSVLGSTNKEFFEDGYVAYIIYTMFSCVVPLILLNLFVMIVSDNYTIIKQNEHSPLYDEDETLLDHVLEKLKQMADAVLKRVLNKRASVKPANYVDKVGTFKEKSLTLAFKIDHLIKDKTI